MENIKLPGTYEELKRNSIGDNKEEFWRQWAEEIKWSTFPETILDSAHAPFYKWFSDGKLNITENCLDRHIEELGDLPAYHYEGPIAGVRITWTYKQLLHEVEKFSGVLVSNGISKGDTVIIYMPMILEAAAVILACARIGAIHSVVFGGFAAKELSGRIKDSGAKIIVSASCGLEPHKVVEYRPLIREALDILENGGMANITETKVIYVQREQHKLSELLPTEAFYKDEMEKATPQKAVQVDSTHPLYILYTSGTTGDPKGIVRDCGGTAVALNLCLDIGFDLQKRDVMFATSDIGWVVGHSYMIYGPLLRGATSIFYEGKPNTPDAGSFYEICERHKVKVFYTSPTAIRFLKKLDPEHTYPKKYNLSTMKVFGIVGERTDINTYDYIKEVIPVDCLYTDTYWQTETGWFISANFVKPERFAVKGGSCTKTFPGYDLCILDDESKEVSSGKSGHVVIKLPMPPSFMSTLWRNDEFFKLKYLSQFEGYYCTADSGYIDADGYIHIMSRVDDVINTAGHRLSTASLEECLNSHPIIAESAVVGGLDDVKGTVPVGFVVIKDGSTANKLQLEKDLVKLVRHDIGPVACLNMLFVVDKLPKTRSGKILRRTLKCIIDGKEFKIPPTIEDPSVLKSIKKVVLDHGQGKKKNIVFEEDEVEKKLKVDQEES